MVDGCAKPGLNKKHKKLRFVWVMGAPHLSPSSFLQVNLYGSIHDRVTLNLGTQLLFQFQTITFPETNIALEKGLFQ